MKLRTYQQLAVDSALAKFAAGDQSTLILCPTGGGKTVIFGHIAKSVLARGRVMVLAHRDELIRQAADKLGQITSVLPVIEKADERSMEEGMHGKPPIVVSSIQTQISGKGERKRMHRFFPDEFSLIIIDEAHHSPAQSYRRVISHYASNPNCKIVGVTATADRADKLALGAVFESVAFTYELPDIIADGYLVPIHQRRVTIEGLDFSKVRTTAGDLNSGDLEEAMLFEEPLHGVAHATLEVACDLDQGSLESLKDDPDRSNLFAQRLNAYGMQPKKSLVFAVSVAHAERLSEIFNRWIPGSSDFIHGKQSPERRKHVLKSLRQGDIRFLIGCMVPTEGFDEPSIEMIAMARPTKSRSLYSQMAGRGTRPDASIAERLGELESAVERIALIANSLKPNCLILDFVGNSGRHQLVTTADLLGGKYPPEVVAAANKLAENSTVDMSDALKRAAIALEEKKRVAEEKQRKAEEAAERRRQAEAAKRAELVATASYSTQDVNPFDRQRLQYNAADAKPSHAHLKPKTVNALRGAKVPEAIIAKMSPEEAVALAKKVVHRRLAGLCTYSQGACLLRAGYSKHEIEPMTFAAASAAIEAVKANGWKRPSEVA